MKTILRLLKFIEIKTKITSLLTFLFVVSYFNFKKLEFSLLKSLLFLFGLLFIDFFATAINNYFDSKKNNIPLVFPRNTARKIITVLFILSIIFGVLLVIVTDINMLFLGGFCFLFSVLYSYGPLPFSHTPFGEILSGFFYGFMIPFLLFYINIPEFILFDYISNQLYLSISLPVLQSLIILSIIPFLLTANIMLANNICDLEQDEKIGRYTLVHYIGKKNSLRVFAFLHIIIYLVIIYTSIGGLFYPITILTLFTIPIIIKNIQSLFREQSKERTFPSSTKNFMLILLTHLSLSLFGYLLL